MTLVDPAVDPAVDRKATRTRSAIREVALVAALFLAYKLGRVAAEGHVADALANAHAIWHLERILHMPSEFALQHAVVGHEWLIKAANCYYAYVHFPATAACLIWLWIKRPEHYVHFRRTLAWLTGIALIVHVVMPLAPPRMLTGMGMLDTGRLFGPSVYGTPATDTLSNQYAAMPSLHFGWAMAVALALIGTFTSRKRWLWLLHPIITIFVVVATGNHYWSDIIAAGVMLSFVLVLQPATAPVPAIPRPRTSEG